jgi:hypothetical protein
VAHHFHGELPITLAGFTGTQRLRALPPLALQTASTVPDTVIGQPVGRLPIPKIGILDAIVEGVGRPSSSRDRAPPGTSLPGEDGNVAIAEHRSTYAHRSPTTPDSGP